MGKDHTSRVELGKPLYVRDQPWCGAAYSVGLADLAESSRESVTEPAGSIRREVGDLSVSGAADFLQGDLDAQVAAVVAVVEHGHGPGRGSLVVVVAGMVV